MSQNEPQNDNAAAFDFGPYSSYLAFQAPLPVSFAAAVHGIPVRPLADAFTYVELGAGSGQALALLADAHPQARFIGIEPDAGLAARARTLASTGGLSNMEIIEAPLDGRAVPEADVIVLSTLYSWVPPGNRRALLAGLAPKLKPEGILCLQYSALPGAGASDALYMLLKSVSGSLDGESMDKLRGAVGRAVDMARNGAMFFQSTPLAAQHLEGITQSDPALGVREVSRTLTHSLYVTEVMAELAASGFAFAGNGQLELNFAELTIPAPLRAVAESVRDPAVRELLVDYGRNTAARVDLFVRADSVGERDPAMLLGDFLVARMGEGEQTLARQQLAQNTGVDFTAGVYTDILNGVSHEPRTVTAILDLPAVRKHARHRALKALQLLIGARFCQIVRSKTSLPVGMMPERVKFASRLNAHLFEADVATARPLALSAPISGVRVTLSMPDRWLLHASMGGALEPVFQTMASNGIELKLQDGSVAGLDTFKTSVLGDLLAFRSRTGQQLYSLGVIVAA